MIETLQTEENITVQDVPKLLVEWSSPWEEFVTSIRPALKRSPARLAGEAPYGMLPYRGMVPSMLLEAFLILAAIVVPVKIKQMRPYVAPVLSSHDVIYYSGDELPRTEDLAGAETGAKGQSGGRESHHRTQTIRIARGNSLTAQVVDAPNLKLPSSRDAVANLLAVRPDPGPPPAEGLRSSRSALRLQAPVVAPAPNVIHDYTRNGVQLDAVIAPAPTTPRDPFRSAPNLSATVVPPAPSVSNEHTLVAPALGSSVIAPVPKVSRDQLQNAPSLRSSIVAPAPSVAAGASRSAPALSSAVIPPAPGSVSREVSSAPVQMAKVAVVPPPVSAPERASQRDPKLALPSQTVIAPPPSADITRDMRRLASGNAPDPSKSVVAPPPTVQSSSGSLMSSLIGKIFGASDVVPPPPNVQAGANATTSTSLASNIVPPPPSVANTGNAGIARGRRNGLGSAPGSNVIAPPPTDGIAGGSGVRPRSGSTAPALGPANVVPPPPALLGASNGGNGGVQGSPGGTQLAENVVPPPPAVAENSSGGGSGLGRKWLGFGSALDVGAPSAPRNNAGSGGSVGAVISGQPGSKVGLPPSGGKGSLATSPSGGEKAGLGGSGGGTGIARGEGTGSSLNGAGPGAGKTSSGRGSDPDARGGISPANGPGGAGNAPSGNPSAPGISVQGGSTIVTLPSFGSAVAVGDPAPPAHSSGKPPQSFGVNIVATAGSGGAFEPYKDQFKGEKYTTYIDSSIGQVVMEYGDGTSGGRATMQQPLPIRTELPAGLPRARMVVTCTLDASGNIKNVHVLEPGPAGMTARVIPALLNWKFQPAMRGNQPVEVTAILGFGINTDDRL